MDAALQIIKDIDSEKSLNEGPLQIRTFINNIKAEIRIFVKNGNLINFDIFNGWSVDIKETSIDRF